MGAISSETTPFGYYSFATFLMYTFLTWLLIAHNEGKDTWSILSRGDVGAIGAIKYTLNGHDRDIFMTSKPIKISKFIGIC